MNYFYDEQDKYAAVPINYLKLDSPRIGIGLPNVEDIEIILSPDATIIKNHYNKTKTIVKKYEDDTENRELAVTFGLLKNLGITPAQVQKMMANAKDYRVQRGKKHAKKDSND